MTFQAVRARKGASKKLVLYSARHTYGSYALSSTENLFAVAASMGHADRKSMEPYQHHDLTTLRKAIDHRNNSISTFGHNLVTFLATFRSQREPNQFTVGEAAEASGKSSPICALSKLLFSVMGTFAWFALELLKER